VAAQAAAAADKVASRLASFKAKKTEGANTRPKALDNEAERVNQHMLKKTPTINIQDAIADGKIDARRARIAPAPLADKQKVIDLQKVTHTKRQTKKHTRARALSLSLSLPPSLPSSHSLTHTHRLSLSLPPSLSLSLSRRRRV
jgi:hypothetical protein